MRAILLILILAAVAGIAAISSGLIDISQTRPATAPSVATAGGGVEVKRGQSPAFEVQTGSVGVGSRQANVAVPSVTIERKPRSVSVPAIEIRRPQGNEVAPAQ